MVGFRIDFSQDQQADANGDAYSGGKLYCYTNETTTLVTLYSDAAATITAANPIVADSAGRLPVRYVGASSPLTLAFKTSADVAVWSMDDFEPVPNIANSALSAYLLASGATPMTGPLRFAEGAAVASATAIDLDAATGNFLHITGTTTIATITLAQGAMRWVVFDGALTLTHSANLLLGGSDLTTHANMVLIFIGEGAGVTRLIGGMTGSGRPIVESADILLAVGDETTAITAGTAKITFRMPFAMTLDAAVLPRASLTTASSSGVVTIDINESGSSILSTKLTIDQSELTSETAAAAAVLSDLVLADNAVITIDIDGAGTNAAGLKVLLRGKRFASL